jgi:hypothetical protein
MKKILLLTFVLAYACTITHAYAPAYKKKSARHSPIKKLKFGIAAGPALLGHWSSWKLTARGAHPELKPYLSYSFHTNIYGAYQLIDNLDLRLDLSYIRKGNKFTATYTFHDQALPQIELKTITKLDYLQARSSLYFFPQKDFRYFLIVGGYVAYLLSAQDEVYAYKDKQEMRHESDLITKDKDTVKSYDAGVTLGLGYEWEMGLMLSLLSDIGLIKYFQLNKEIYPDTTIDMQTSNLTLYFSVGYNFAKLLQ